MSEVDALCIRFHMHFDDIESDIDISIFIKAYTQYMENRKAS